MGVTELFHFRRLMRKSRRVGRVADGSRSFVIGLDKSSSDANCSSSPSTKEGVGVFLKGSHFIVAFNSSVQLSEQEMDVCNNNVDRANRGPRRQVGETPIGTLSNGDVVVFTMKPGASSIGQHNPGGTNNMSTSTSAAAVITTTELEEVRLFTSN